MKITLSNGRHSKRTEYVESAADLINVLKYTPYTRVEVRNARGETLEMRRKALEKHWKKHNKVS